MATDEPEDSQDVSEARNYFSDTYRDSTAKSLI